MSNEFFVMIYRQDDRGVVPMTRGQDVAMFATAEDAKMAAENCDMACVLGYDVFRVGCGVEGGDPL